MVNFFTKFFFVCKKIIRIIYRKANSFSCPIIKKPEDIFEIVAKVKDSSWEKTFYAECFGHNKEQQLEVFSPAELIYKINNGIVVEGSDVVVTEQGALWGKYNKDEFCTYLVPLDSNLVSFDRDFIRLVNFKCIEEISGRVIPLIGCSSHHWVHSIYEFLPRLFSAGEVGLLNNPITILVIENQDNTILEIIYSYLKDYPFVNIKRARNSVAYKCEELYFQPVVGPSCSGYKFRLDYPWYIPQYIVNQVNQYIVAPALGNVIKNAVKYEKLFIGRTSKYARNSRNLKNFEEIHNFFLREGFVDVEPASLSLVEKADIFYHAKEIVLLHGAAIMNLIFCNNAKCMVLGNYRFATDSIGYSFVRSKVSNYVYVTGQDDSSDFHSSYYIPLDKVKTVYKEIFA